MFSYFIYPEKLTQDPEFTYLWGQCLQYYSDFFLCNREIEGFQKINWSESHSQYLPWCEWYAWFQHSPWALTKALKDQRQNHCLCKKY